MAGNVAKPSHLISLLSSFDFYQFLNRTSNALLYCGLFLLPVLILFLGQIKRNIQGYRRIVVIGIIIFTVSYLLIGGVHFPFGNVFYNLGLGPKVLKDAYWNINVLPQINHDLWVIMLKTLGIIAVVGLIFIINWRSLKIKELIAFSSGDNRKIFIEINLLLIAIGYLVFLILNKTFFDRYTIPLFVCIFLIILPYVRDISNTEKYIAVCILLIGICFSIFATHDYLSWNRSRWKAIDHLVYKEGISPKTIDGGFEFNAWYNTAPKTEINRMGKSWWFVNNDIYVISFGDIENYHKKLGFYYSQWLSPKKDSIFILQRTSPNFNDY